MIFFKPKKLLYFPGCLVTSVMPEIAKNYEHIFHHFLNLNVFKISENICCGAVAYFNGYTKDFEALKEKTKEIFEMSTVKNIVTNSPACFWTLGKHYGFKVQHVSQFLSAYKAKLPILYDEEISYYDSPNLMIYDEPRAILEAIGLKIIELERNREDTVICGAEGGMIQNIPLLANKLAKPIFNMCKTKKLVVADPLAYYHLKNNAPPGIKVFELGELFKI